MTARWQATSLALAAAACARRAPVEAGPPGPYVSSEPPGLAIVLDGRPLGRTTPAQIESWEPLLPHEIVLEAPGRVPFRQELAPGSSPARIDARLPPAAFLAVQSDPPGATVAVAGLTLAPVTPATVAFPAGVATQVTLTLDGYLPEAATVTGPAGETVQLSRRLKRGELVDLQSDPQGANVELDGVGLGKAPLQRPVEVARSHVARMSLPGLLPCERRFEVKAKKPVTVACDLDDARARLLRSQLRHTQLELKMAQRQLDALGQVHPVQMAAAVTTERRRGRLQELVERLSDREEQQQGDLDSHRTALEERFEHRLAQGGSR